MRGRLLHIIVALLFILYPIVISAASLPDGMGTGDGTYNSGSYSGGYDNNYSTDPMLQRIINNNGSGVTPIQDGVGGWVLTDQTPTEPYQYWSNSTLTDNTGTAVTGFATGDTLVFTDGDSISLWTGTYPGFLEYLMIYDNGNDNPLGAVEYFEEVPLEDGTFPLLLLLTLYGSYKLKRKKKALS